MSRGIVFGFEKDGYTVLSAGTMKDGKNLFTRNKIDLIVLDLSLPDGDGGDLCKKIRETSSIPIVMLTARDMETDEVSGLMSGADDYITKPFSLAVLRARVEALFRRAEKSNTHIVQTGKYRLDTSLCKFYRINFETENEEEEAEEITISSTEFRILNFLMANAGQVLTKDQILAALWDNQGNYVDDNTVPVNISRLRAKIEDDPKKPQTIKTIHGMGYIWVKE